MQAAPDNVARRATSRNSRASSSGALQTRRDGRVRSQRLDSMNELMQQRWRLLKARWGWVVRVPTNVSSVVTIGSSQAILLANTLDQLRHRFFLPDGRIMRIIMANQ